MSTLTQLTKALNSAVESIGGIDAAMAACDKMYRATFRSEPVKLSSCDDWEGKVTCLFIEAAVALYCKETGYRLPVKQELEDFDGDWGALEEAQDRASDNFYYEMEALEDNAESWLEDTHPDFKITGDTLVVDFCNYKGEGEGGLSLYSLNSHLNVFRSKRESFDQANGF